MATAINSFFIGITPTYAGNTSSPQLSLELFQDHPRIRGEHDCYRFRYGSDKGSPPHTWGTHRASLWGSKGRGITPAYAGNTSRPHKAYGIIWDHPRIRGEHVKPATFVLFITGSPPHTRGTQPITVTKSIRGRITPAYAGNTCWKFSIIIT